jgi:hypothetical protein
MRSGWKDWALLAGVTLGLATLAAPSRAQYAPPPIPAAAPPSDGAPPPDAGGPAPAKGNPFSLQTDGAPNAFCDDECAPVGQSHYCFMLRGEYLQWYIANNGHVPVTLATSSTSPNIIGNRGVPGQPNTFGLYGPAEYTYHSLPGGRVTLALAPEWCIPLEITGFWISRGDNLFSFIGNGGPQSPVLARPFNRLDATGPFGLTGSGANLINFPNRLAGEMRVNTQISLWGVEANIFAPCCDTDCLGLGVIAGYRNANMNESFDIATSKMPINGFTSDFGNIRGGFGPGNRIDVIDSYWTRNAFNGGQLGLRAALFAWRFTLSTDLKLAVGNTNSVYNATGISTLMSGNGAVNLPGGVLVTQANGGQQSQNRISVIPEINCNLRFRIFDCMHFMCGYNLFYWSSVLRASDYVTDRVNGREIPTDANFRRNFHAAENPAILHSTGFMAHGINVGFEFGF